MKCKARQFSDSMVCKECDLTWDINDPDPPYCRPKKKKSEIEIQFLYNTDAYVPTAWTFPTFAFEYAHSVKHSLTLLFVCGRQVRGIRLYW